MSFILDALKRSENERQRTIGPSLTDAPVHRHESGKPWWMIAVGALLVINLIVLIVVLARGRSEPAPAIPAAAPATTAVQSAAPPPVQSAPVTAPARPAGNPAVRSLAEEAGASTEPYSDDSGANPAGGVDPEHPDLAAAANVPEGPPLVRPVNPPAVAPLSPQAAAAARNASQASAEVLPTANSLTASGTPLPEMRLDIHVYSNTPSERFVFINMHKYTEGETTSEGPVLERITPEGAILNLRGLRFMLPRQ